MILLAFWGLQNYDAIEDEVFADVPTLIEKGFDVNLQVWQGIGAPKGIPSDIKEVLEKGFEEIINDPEFIEEAEKIGIDVNYMDADEFEELWEYQIGRASCRGRMGQ